MIEILIDFLVGRSQRDNYSYMLEQSLVVCFFFRCFFFGVLFGGLFLYLGVIVGILFGG
jgi:hypothetical protein